MDDPETDIVLAGDFDAAVRFYTGSSTYSSDRGAGAGTGTVAAKKLATPHGPVIVVNAAAIGDAEDGAIERLLAHETGHVLIDGRGETLQGRQHLATVEWEWQLVCLAAAFAMHELRVERAVGEAGYPPADGASAEHITEVLHATTVDLLLLLQDPAAADPRRLMEGVLGLLDRLTKVLAYAAAQAVVTGRPPDVSGEGLLTLAAWGDYVTPTWTRRLALYTGLPPATVPLPAEAWNRALAARPTLEQDLLRNLGFAFEEEADDGYGFYRRVDDAQLDARLRRVLASSARTNRARRLLEATAADGAARPDGCRRLLHGRAG